MAEDYQKVIFKNGEAPAVNATNLNHMQTQYEKAKALVVAHEAEKATDEDLGHVKQGSRITIDGNGVINADLQANVASGSYTGDGTSGREINIGFAPKLVIVTDYENVAQFISVTSTGNISHRYHSSTASQMHQSATNVKLSATGFVVDNAGTGNQRANVSDVTYNYVAIG